MKKFCTVTDPNAQFIWTLEMDKESHKSVPVMDNDLIEYILADGKFYNHDVNKIYQMINSDSSCEEQHKFVEESIGKDCYNYLFASDGKTYVGYKGYEQGVALWKGSPTEPKAYKALTWNEIFNVFKSIASKIKNTCETGVFKAVDMNGFEQLSFF